MSNSCNNFSDWLKKFIAEEKLPVEFAAVVKDAYGPIASQIAGWRAAQDRPLAVALNGAQGTGKSTLAGALAGILQHRHGLVTAILSIDDLYLTQAERRKLADSVHPLLQTRGVPGTHDIQLGMDIAKSILSQKPGDKLLPRFDKSIDDRAPEALCPVISQAVDVLILEGWCVGALPQPVSFLAQPINSLERLEDPNGVWRTFVNAHLAGEYQQLFGLFDRLIMLKAPHFKCVHGWRGEQESKLRARVAAAGQTDLRGVMDEAALHRFIMHYERLTRWMLEEMPGRADIVVHLTEDRQVDRVFS